MLTDVQGIVELYLSPVQYEYLRKDRNVKVDYDKYFEDVNGEIFFLLLRNMSEEIKISEMSIGLLNYLHNSCIKSKENIVTMIHIYGSSSLRSYLQEIEDKGVKSHYVNNDLTSRLSWAVLEKAYNVDHVKEVYMFGEKVDFFQLCYYSKTGFLEGVKFVSKLMNSKSFIDNASLNAALQFACEYRQPAIIKYFLEEYKLKPDVSTCHSVCKNEDFYGMYYLIDEIKKHPEAEKKYKKVKRKWISIGFAAVFVGFILGRIHRTLRP